MATPFEWDETKAEANVHKHGIGFDEAQTVFLDEWAIIYPDPDHSVREERFLIIGDSNKHRLLIAALRSAAKLSA